MISPVAYGSTLPPLPPTPGTASPGVPSTPILTPPMPDYAYTVPSYPHQGSIPATPASSLMPYSNCPPTKPKDLKIWHTFEDIIGEELFERYGINALRLKMGTRRALDTVTASALENECEMTSYCDRQQALEKIAAVLFNLKSYFPGEIQPIHIRDFISEWPPVIPEQIHQQMYWPADAGELFSDFGIRMHKLVDGSIPGLSPMTVFQYKRAYFFHVVTDSENSMSIHLRDLIDGCIADDNPPAKMKEILLTHYEGYGTVAGLIATIATGNVLLNTYFSAAASRASFTVMVTGALSATYALLCALSSADIIANVSQCPDEAIHLFVAFALDRWYFSDILRFWRRKAALLSTLFDPLHLLLFSVFFLGLSIWNAFVVYAESIANNAASFIRFKREQYEMPLPCQQLIHSNVLLYTIANIFTWTIFLYVFRRSYLTVARRLASLGYCQVYGQTRKPVEEETKIAEALHQARLQAKAEERKKLPGQIERFRQKAHASNDLASPNNSNI